MIFIVTIEKLSKAQAPKGLEFLNLKFVIYLIFEHCILKFLAKKKQQIQKYVPIHSPT
jgi:hypothetical protein